MPDVPKYDHKEIEPRWQRRWEEIGLFRPDGGATPLAARPKYYGLMMFPYPSGDRLHVGHGRNYILGDVIVRYKIMCGRNVLSPMGWDAFGLPAENDAIKKKIAPWVSVRNNIGRMKQQFAAWGVGYDWSRELATCDPAYYKWTQWLFLKLYEKNLAYRKKAPVNWCPDCKTVLANEQVEDDDTCERCGTKVEKRDLTQWFFRITQYADRLIDDLEKLGTWPERVKTLQRNWINRSTGTRIDFTVEVPRKRDRVEDAAGAPRAPAPVPIKWDDTFEPAPGESGEVLPVFTTRPDTLFGVTFVSVAPEHPLVARATAPGVKEFAAKAIANPDRVGDAAPKEGIATGLFATNPANGERVPIYVASYALMEYGTGAVMAVPAHDQRDFDFAKKYSLPIKVVIRPADAPLAASDLTAAFTDTGVMADSGPFTGTNSQDGKAKVTEWLEQKGHGAAETRYRLRDWLVSRQRYWGAPIPIVACPKCGDVAVPEAELPVLLPHDRGIEVEVRPSGTGKSPLANVPEFVSARCPKCGGPAERETDTMDTFVDSSWYFLRYVSPKLDSAAFDQAEAARWLPVDQYIGGAEHATKHLIYARFITKFLKDEGHVPFDEPFTNLFSQGLICKRDAKGDLQKMSKSKGNVVNPDELIEKFGADTERLYTLFIGPPERDAEWQDDGIMGSYRFLNRLWTLVHEVAPTLPNPGLAEAAPGGASALSPAGIELRRKRHETVGEVTRDIDGKFGFNTAISSVMELVNLARALTPQTEGDRFALRDALEATVVLLAPMVPHVAEELWRVLGRDVPTIFREKWPTHDPELAKRAEVEIPIQVNGKVRGREVVPRDAPEEELKTTVLANERVKGYVSGKTIVKVIVIPNKLVNIVVK